MSEQFAEVNGIKICYKIEGKGDPLVLIHGFGSKKEVYIGQVPILSRGFKVITFDNRGSGKSTHCDENSEPFTAEMMASDTKELLDHLGIDKAHILGYSLGGMIAQTFALMFPERVHKLILVATTPDFPANESGIKMYKDGKVARYHNLIEDPVKTFWDNATPGFTRQFKKELMADPKKKIHGLFSAEELIEIDKQNPSNPIDIENSGHFLKNFNVYERLPEIQKKTLIIAAGKDKTLPKMLSEKIHDKIPNSKLVIINKCGHGFVQEKAPEVNDAILEFLNE
jgi:3-oxoadipate enol-lactonase